RGGATGSAWGAGAAAHSGNTVPGHAPARGRRCRTFRTSQPCEAENVSALDRIDNKPATEPALDENGDPVFDGNGHAVTGYRLPDNTLVYSNAEATFNTGFRVAWPGAV